MSKDEANENKLTKIGPGQHRQDIDGLRAIAVILVVVFHFNEKLIPGGFVGVDVFFVISGFLITGIIRRDWEKGTFSLVEFFRRRIKRICPPLALVTFVTLIAGVTLLTPSDLAQLSWSALSTTFSIANIYFTFFLDTGYFAEDSSTVPLLHMWSLGVEEQFYLLWPYLLLVLLKYQRATLPVLLVLAIASVFAGEWMLTMGYYSFAYYMLPSRVFQLAAGGILSFALGSKVIKPPSFSILAGGLALSGLLLIFASAWFLDGSDAYPGIKAAPVTLGTLLLLLAGFHRNVFSTIIAAAPLRWLGLISYSLYLWHWPVLAFLRYAYVEIDFLVGILAFAAMIILSIVTFLLVETPTRATKASFASILKNYFLVPSTGIAIVCLILINTHGYGPYLFSSTYKSALAQAQRPPKPAHSYKYICQDAPIRPHDVINPECIINATSEPSVLVWGDSNATHYVGIIGALAKAQGFSFRNIAHSGCPPLSADAHTFAKPKYVEPCRASNEVIQSRLAKYDTIIMAASWSMYNGFSIEFQNSLRRTISELVRNGKRVIIVGQALRFPHFDRKCAEKAQKILVDCESRFSRPQRKQSWVNKALEAMANSLENTDYVDFNNLLCNKGRCSPYINDQPVYFDSGHISMPGSWVLGELATKNPLYENLIGLRHKIN